MKCDIKGCKNAASCVVDDHGVDTHLCAEHVVDFWYNEQNTKDMKVKMGIL